MTRWASVVKTLIGSEESLGVFEAVPERTPEIYFNVPFTDPDFAVTPGTAAGGGARGGHSRSAVRAGLPGGAELHPAIYPARAAPGPAAAHPPGAATRRRADPLGGAAFQ